MRILLLMAGIVAGQVVLYGPSLIGQKILLPLDILTQPGVYLPAVPPYDQVEVKNVFNSDPVYLCEPARQFAGAELRAGRLPLWIPNYFAGAPFIWPKFSPFFALQCLVKSPVILAWSQLLAALVGGTGAFLFFRRILRVSYWSAAITAWCYPLTAVFVFWQGYPTALSVHWLPWAFLVADRTVRNTYPAAPLNLGLVTALVLVSGHLDLAGQVLLASGLFALWCWFDTFAGEWLRKRAALALLRLVTGWTLGFLLAAPYVLPVLEYTRTGARMSHRSAGTEERPPVGWEALPQVVLPDLYGSSRTGSFRLSSGNEMESSAAAYTGLFATLLVAPLAWCSRRYRRINLFWTFLAVLGLGWCLNLPGLVHLLRLPGLNLFSHNRFVFATSFAILAMAATGLDVWQHGKLPWHRWFYVPVSCLAALAAWCAFRLFSPPDLSQLSLAILNGAAVPGVPDVQAVLRIQTWFNWHYGTSILLCALALAGWAWISSRQAWRKLSLPLIAMALVGDLLCFGYRRSSQCDPALYFPTIPALASLANSSPGRVIGYNCLPANIAIMAGLQDIRGYDSVDPARFVDLVKCGADPRTVTYSYAQLHFLRPKSQVAPDGGFRLWPVFDLLGVTHTIFRGSPPPDVRPAFQSPDYWVLANSNALPRAFVPQSVQVLADSSAQLARLAAADFDPRQVAFVEEPVSLPANCRGSVRLVTQVPTRVTLTATMETPGLVVLADMWDPGWRATREGRPVSILRVDHALRGVMVPAGTSVLGFRYAPSGFALGLRLAAGAAILLLGWSAWLCLKRSRPYGADTDSRK